jgi:hypothetical protein
MRVGVMLLAIGIAVLPSNGRASDAPDPPARVPAADYVTIPFAPPIGVPLRYRLERQSLGGRGAGSFAGEFTATFDRHPEGYLLTIQWTIPPDVRPSSPAERLLIQPMTFRLDEDSNIVGFKNETEFWDAAEAILVQHFGGNRSDPAALERARTAYRSFREMSDDQRFSMLGQNFLPIIAMSGTELDPGEPITDKVPMETPFGLASFDIAVSLDSIDRDRARISSVSTIPAAEYERIIRSAAATFGQQTLPPFRSDGIRATESYDVWLATGLTHVYRSERTVEIEEDGERARVGLIQTLTRVD